MVARSWLARRRLDVIVVSMTVFLIAVTQSTTGVHTKRVPGILSCVAGCVSRHGCICFAYDRKTSTCEYRRTTKCLMEGINNDDQKCYILEDEGIQAKDDITTGVFQMTTRPPKLKQCQTALHLLRGESVTSGFLTSMSCGSYLSWNGGNPALVCNNLGIWSGNIHGCARRVWETSSSDILFELQDPLILGAIIYVSGSSDYRKRCEISLGCTNQFVALRVRFEFLNQGLKFRVYFNSKKAQWGNTVRKTVFVEDRNFSVTIVPQESSFRIEMGSDANNDHTFRYEMDVSTVNMVRIVSDAPMDQAYVSFTDAE